MSIFYTDSAAINNLLVDNLTVTYPIIGTASYAFQTLTASTASYSPSSSYALTSSFALNIQPSSSSISSSYSLTSSYISSTSTFDSNLYKLTASVAISSAFAPGSANSVQSNFSTQSLYATSSITSSFSTSASYSITASYAINSIATLTTASTYPVTSSWSITSSFSSTSAQATSITFVPITSVSASWISASTLINTASYSITASYLLGGIASASVATIAQSSSISSTLSGIMYNLVISSGSNGNQPLYIDLNDLTYNQSTSTLYATNVVGTSSYALTASYVPNLQKTIIISGSINTGSYISCQTYNDSAQSIPNGAFTPLSFTVNAWDDAGFHNIVTNNSRLVAPFTGRYRITSTVRFSPNASGFNRLVVFGINGNYGGDYYGMIGGGYSLQGTTAEAGTTTTVLSLNAGDYVETIVYQDSGGALNILADNDSGRIGSFRCTIEYLGIINQVSNTGSYLSAQAYHTQAQTLQSSIFTPISFSSTAWDDANMHPITNNGTRMVAPYSGKYRVTSTIQFTGSLSGTYRYSTFRINGNTSHQYGDSGGSNFTAGGAPTITTVAILNLTSSDYVEVWAVQDSGNPLSLTADTGSGIIGICRFSMEYMGIPIAVSSSYATTSSVSLTASFALNSGTSIITGSTYQLTSSWSTSSISSSYATTASYISQNATIAQVYLDPDNGATYGLQVRGTTGNEYIVIQPQNYNTQSGIISTNIITVTGSYSISSIDYTVLVNSITASTITLPDVIVAGIGKVYNVKNLTSNPVVLTGSQLIDNQPTQTISLQYSKIIVQTDGNSWWIL